jgi:Icc-related predicted phosphoesterase
MKIVYAADLHENRKAYEELLKLVSLTRPDLVILGGDYFRPSRSATSQLRFIEEYLASWLVQLAVPVYFIYGNTDIPLAIERLGQVSERVRLLDLHPVALGDGLTLRGYGMVNISPFKIKHYERRDLASDQYEASQPYLLSGTGNELVEAEPVTLDQLPSIEEELQSIEGGPDSIWVMHAPPYDTKLDMISRTQHVGSRAVRAAIEKHQPLLTLHGHIHESPSISGSWTDRIGETVCVNPGSGTSLYAVTIQIRNNQILNLSHTVL